MLFASVQQGKTKELHLKLFYLFIIHFVVLYVDTLFYLLDTPSFISVILHNIDQFIVSLENFYFVWNLWFVVSEQFIC